MCGIYAIVNRNTQRVYIGSSVEVETRWANHRRDLNRGTHHCQPLQRSWHKHGELSFDFVLLEQTDDRSVLPIRETARLAAVTNPYNVATVIGRPPSRRGFRASDEVKAKMSIAHTGRTHTEETRRKMSNSWRDRSTPESLAKMSASLMGRSLSPEHRAKVSAVLDRYRGFKHSDASKAKMRASKLGRRHSVEALAKMSVFQKGRPKTAEHRAKISATHLRRHQESRLNV